MGSKLYHLGIRGAVSRSTLAGANDCRDWRVYADLAHVLIALARPLYAEEPFGVDLADTVYALDATTIDVCLSLSPVSAFPRCREDAYAPGSARQHSHLHRHYPRPLQRSRRLGSARFSSGRILCHGQWLPAFPEAVPAQPKRRVFVTRADKNTRYRRLYSRPVDSQTGLRSDQTIRLTGRRSRQHA